MKYIEQAIKEAVEKGGYNGDPSLPAWSQKLPWKDVFLDPSFWQALGRAWGWRDDEGTLYGRKMWHTQWVYFIDHLAQEKDAESFFESLLK